MTTIVLALLVSLCININVWALQGSNSPPCAVACSRRSWMLQAPATGAAAAMAHLLLSPQEALAGPDSPPPPDLKFVDTSSGLSYADAKVGTGQPITSKGSKVTIDYVLPTTGARYGSKIYSSATTNNPYRFALGDGSTIAGIELAIAGGDGVEPMRPGGIRRAIIPAKLGYQRLATDRVSCKPGGGLGPIPPVQEGNSGEYYQRFKNIYCNPDRVYQPDVVMDIKLYGKR